jgi:protein-disulfide isomerase
MQEEKNKGFDVGGFDAGNIVGSLRNNPWIASTAILVLVLIIVLVFKGSVSGNAVSADDAAKNLISFINAQGAGSAEVVSSDKNGSFYLVTVKYNGRDVPVYVTLDGGYLVPSMIPLSMNAVSDESAAEESPPAEAVKSDKPKVELFVMTHCPYGTQAEKGIMPAVKALGSKIDAKIRFVHYFMHGDEEEQETYTQVCIREEQSAKFWNYLECFLQAGDSASCITKAGVDKAKLSACTGASGKAKEYYAVDKGLSNQYGVQGSPALVINGAESGAGRSPSSYLLGICEAFNSAPSAECSKQLSSATPSAGFGTAASESGSAAGGCGA